MTPRILHAGADLVSLAALHCLCFGQEAWSAEQLAGSLALSTTAAFGVDHAGQLAGFVLVQIVQGEGEILTLGVDPSCRRLGLAAALLDAVRAIPALMAVFLEVAADNAPACRLYEMKGFMLMGRRVGYYQRGLDRIDALTYRLMVNGPRAC